MKKYLLILYVVFFVTALYAQNNPKKQAPDTVKKALNLDELILSANKWEQNLNEVPNKIIKINRQEILRNNPQTAADLLGQSGAVFVQKSQLGGGSPMIRGFATNRVLIVVDGVRMNNAIYRSGNLQNIISIDPLSVQTAEVIFGPGSIIYGSDAIGGVMDFHTLEPQFANGKKLLVKSNALVRYSTANKENTFHADVNIASKKWSFLSSVTHSNFDDLKMGNHGGHDSYHRQEYAERINGTDSIVKNSDPRIQKFSGYEQFNFLQKIGYNASQYINIQYSFTYAQTGTAPRYDRLIQYRNGRLRFAEWNYGPMIWRMHNLQLAHKKKNSLYNEARLTAAYQNYNESRIDRAFNSNNRNLLAEKVNAISINWDAFKLFKKSELFYGIEYVFNRVGSTGSKIDINSAAAIRAASRYPDGSKLASAGLYITQKININSKLTLSTGLRYSYNLLKANFDTSFIKFPFTKTQIKDGAFTGNGGIVFRPANNWQFNANIATGFRMPNIDDVGKLFENVPRFITVPNPSLTSEYAWSFELGIIKTFTDKIKIEINGFYTILDNAIVKRPFTLNGQDSIIFDGLKSRVEALQNVAKVTVYGLQTNIYIRLNKHLSFLNFSNVIKGKETDDSKSEQVALRHAPPFYGSTHLKLNVKKYTAEILIQYNSSIQNKNLAPSEQAKTDIYATDSNGKPYSPGWYSLNFKASYQVNKKLLITTGYENITNQLYRPYSSGIVAAASNFIVGFRASL